LNVEPKTQKSFQGSNNIGSQGNARNPNYQTRSGGGGNRGGGNRGPYRASGNNQRRGGGAQYRNNSPSFTGGDENYKVQQQQ